MKKIKLLTPILGFTTLLGAATATIGCSCSHIGGDEPEPIETVDFNTCDWSIVVDACNKLENDEWTEQQFCQRFKFGQTQATKLDDFVGKERITMLNGSEHKVIVVGSQQDYLDEAKTKPVALTFQYINLISAETTGNALNTHWYDFGADVTDGDNYNYWNSKLNNALNSENGYTEWRDLYNNIITSEDRSVLMMMNDSDPVLHDGIKNVYRTAIVTEDSAVTWITKTQTTKLFCPCMGNYFSDDGINSDDNITNPDQKALYCSEATQYKYYEMELEDIQPTYADPEEQCMQRKDVAGNVVDCWFTTPEINTLDCAWLTNGRVDDDGVCWSHAILPCFCL